MDATKEPIFEYFRSFICLALTGIMVGLMVMGCAPRPTPIPEGTDTHWYGNIVSGEKFGVKIGDDYSSARDILADDGFRSDGVVTCSKDTAVGIPECSEPHEAGVFRLRRFGKDGNVYLILNDKVVVQIVWSFAVISLP